MGAGFGIGLLLGRASDYQKAGLSLAETYTLVERDRDNLCEFFTVDDLMFLRRTGRLSGVTATLGTMLQLKPLLRGDESGHITVFNKVRGRKRLWRPWPGCTGSGFAGRKPSECIFPTAIARRRQNSWRRWSGTLRSPKELIVCLHEPLTGATWGRGCWRSSS